MRLWILFLLLLFGCNDEEMRVNKLINYLGSSTSPYNQASNALFAKWLSQGVVADDTRKVLVNTFIEGMIADGDFSELDGLWILAAHAKVATYVNWKSPSSTIATITGTVSWAEDVSLMPNGVDSFIDLEWNPSSDAIKFTLNSNTYGLGVLRDRGGADKIHGVFHSISSYGTMIYPRTSGNLFYGLDNSTSSPTSANTNSKGKYYIKRTASNAVSIGKNGSQTNTGTNASSSIVNATYTLGAVHYQTDLHASYSDDELSYFYIGSSAIVNSRIEARIQTFLDAISVETDILAGQSNAVGWTTSLVSSLSATLKLPIPNAYIYNNINDAWEQLLAGTNNQGQSALYHGIEMSYMYDIAQATGKRRNLIKYAVGGTMLHNNNGADSWHPDNTNPSGLYTILKSRIQAAKDASDKTLNIRNFIWYQGETDGGVLSWANEYAANLADLISTLRTDLGLPYLNIIIIKVHSNLSGFIYVNTVRAGDDTVDAADVRVLCVDSDNYEPTVLHLNSASMVSLGSEVALQCIKF